MKFNEKLINLRKSKGMSQEELGEKLNVTRQTVSKWELGQTTPEMDKLIEIAKIFNMSLDELTNEEIEEVQENIKIKDKKVELEKRNKVSIILSILLIMLIIIAAIYGVNKISNKNKGGLLDEILNQSEDKNKQILDFFNEQSGIMLNNFDENSEKSQEKFNEQLQNIQNIFNEQVENIEKNSEKEYLTKTLENLYNGTKNGFFVKSAIDKIVTNNKKEESKIIVTYKENSISDTKELQNLKSNFKDTVEYEISFEYDQNGYINEMDIWERE